MKIISNYLGRARWREKEGDRGIRSREREGTEERVSFPQCCQSGRELAAEDMGKG